MTSQIVETLSCSNCGGPLQLTDTKCSRCGIGVKFDFAKLMGGVTGYDPSGRNSELDAFLLGLVTQAAEEKGIHIKRAQDGNALEIYLYDLGGTLVRTGQILEYVTGTQIGVRGSGTFWKINYKTLLEGGRIYEISSVYGESLQSVEGVEGLKDLPRIQQWVQDTLAPALPAPQSEPAQPVGWRERMFGWLFRPVEPEWP